MTHTEYNSSHEHGPAYTTTGKFCHPLQRVDSRYGYSRTVNTFFFDGILFIFQSGLTDPLLFPVHGNQRLYLAHRSVARSLLRNAVIVQIATTAKGGSM